MNKTSLLALWLSAVFPCSCAAQGNPAEMQLLPSAAPIESVRTSKLTDVCTRRVTTNADLRPSGDCFGFVSQSVHDSGTAMQRSRIVFARSQPRRNTKGRMADLTAVQGDPLPDIATMAHVVSVTTVGNIVGPVAAR